MKNTIYLFMLSVILLFSCGKESIDDVFENSPEQRVTEKLERLKKALVPSENGWYIDYTYNFGNTQMLLWLQFKDDNRAEISSSYSLDFLNRESTYNLRYAHQENLEFTTNSVFSQFVVNKEASDIIWELQSISENEIVFKGRTTKETIVLKKSDGSEKLAVEQKFRLKQKLLHGKEKPYYRNLSITGLDSQYALLFNPANFTVSFKNKDTDGTIQELETAITVTSDDSFRLDTPLVVNGEEVTDFVYDSTNNVFKIVSETVNGTIDYGAKPFSRTDNPADVFISTNVWYSIKSPSFLFEKVLEQLKQLPGKNHDVQIYNLINVKATLVGSTIKGEGSWVGPFISEYKKIAPDEIQIISNNEQFFNHSQESEEIMQPYTKLIFNEKGFDIIPDGKGNFTFVSIDDPAIYFKLILRQ